MTQSDSLLVENRSKYAVLVIDGDQLSGCNALEGLMGMDVTLVTSLEDAALLISRKKFDYILSSGHAAGERGGKQCRLEAEIVELALRLNCSLCFISRTDDLGNEVNGKADNLTLRAASSAALEENLPLVRKSRPGEGILGRMRFTAVYTMPGTERSPKIWSKGLEILQAMCLSPKAGLKAPEPSGNRRPTPIPKR